MNYSIFLTVIFLLYHQPQGSHIDIASRWFDGLINNDTEINNEVYSIQNVDFDRQVSWISSLELFPHTSAL